MITTFSVRLKSKLQRYESEQSREKRMWLLRSIISAAHDEHDRLLSELASLSDIKADPALEVPV